MIHDGSQAHNAHMHVIRGFAQAHLGRADFHVGFATVQLGGESGAAVGLALRRRVRRLQLHLLPDRACTSRM